MTDDVMAAIRDFVASFEAVFGNDWQYARHPGGDAEQAAAAHATGLEASPTIAEGATFLEPGVDDEVEDWGNRAVLLQAYRRLKRLLPDL